MLNMVNNMVIFSYNCVRCESWATNFQSKKFSQKSLKISDSQKFVRNLQVSNFTIFNEFLLTNQPSPNVV